MFGPPGCGKSTFLKDNKYIYYKYSKIKYILLYLLYIFYFLINKKEFKSMRKRFILLRFDKFYVKNIIRSLVKQHLQSKSFEYKYFIPDESFYHLLICFGIFCNLTPSQIFNFSEINKKNLNFYIYEVDKETNIKRLNARKRNKTWKNRVTLTNKEIVIDYNHFLQKTLNNIDVVRIYSQEDVANNTI